MAEVCSEHYHQQIQAIGKHPVACRSALLHLALRILHMLLHVCCVLTMQVSVELKSVSANSKEQQTCSAAADGSSSQPACSTEAVQGAVPPAFPPNAGVFTTKQLKEGDLLAVIPVELGYAVRKGIAKLVSVFEDV
jgi:hypothetical protein